jgi:class 3 adenylate cyclase
MPARVSLKISILMFLGSLACAVGIVFPLNFLFSGPKLGLHYDLLLNYKKPVVSNEILIIETDEFIEGGDFFTVLLTLTEMEAANLILAGRLSPSTTPITLTEADIRRNFIDEYALLGSNIRNLFEGIRMGFVQPAQAPFFVDQVVESAQQGRERLIKILIDRDEELIRSVAVFGNYLDAYSKPQLDKDGKLRRVKPVEIEGYIEHPLYANLKNRYEVSQIETTDKKLILWLRGYDGKDLDITLDNDGNIITPWNCDFRRVDIELFRKYEETGNAMLDLLAQANELKVFYKVLPEQIPLFLGEYAQTLLEDLIKSPNSENRSAWIAARSNYFNSLETFFDNYTEAELISGYEELIADTDSSREKELDRLISTKNELMNVFTLMREAYEELSSSRYKLKEQLGLSLCIMGHEPNVKYSAMLANALITGGHIKPVNQRYVMLLSIAAVFVVLIIIFMMRPVVLLIIGLLLSVLSAGLSGGVFILYSYWIDPLIVFGSSFVSVFVLFYCKSAYLNYRARAFRSAYRTAVSKDVLRRLIYYGRPGLSEINVTYAAVIAIKDTSLFTKEDKEVSKDLSKMKKVFYSSAKKILFNAGAVIAGYEGDTILACFGSPLELQPKLTTHKWSEDGQSIAKSYHPADKACALVRRLLRNEKITWQFGIDSGLCTFSWSPETGFSVSGSPAVRARVLVSRTTRIKARALISYSVREKINLDDNGIIALPAGNGSFYELKP